MIVSENPRVMREVREENRLWTPPPRVEVPSWAEAEAPPEEMRLAPTDRTLYVNTVPGEVEAADEQTLAEEIWLRGRIETEPEIARHLDGRAGGYSDTYWTHFDWRPDTKRFVVRIQKRFPWATFINTYYQHPPVYGRRYEFVSFDVWDGGLSNGRYVGYRGKPLGDYNLGTRIFNAIFNDPYSPPIYWIVYRGRMWTRGYGWTESPGGPPDSDPEHNGHIHLSALLSY